MSHNRLPVKSMTKAFIFDAPRQKHAGHVEARGPYHVERRPSVIFCPVIG